MGIINDWLSSLRSKRSADSASELQSKTTQDEGDYRTTYENAMKAYKEGDYKTAYRLFKPMADQGYPEIQLFLGFLYSLRQIMLPDPMEAGNLSSFIQSIFIPSMMLPDPIEVWKLYTGKLYRKEAVEWYRKAADQGGADIKYKLGYMFEDGKGVPQDFAEAKIWYRRAADQGHADAQYSLGYMYENRKGVPQDYTEAAKWYRKAADQGHADAQYSLGVMYEKGQGVPQDYAEAEKWYRKAADQGYAYAPYNLARKYAKDHAEAAKWYRKAADQGHADAQYSVCYMYKKGKGVPQDYAEAQRLAREWKQKKK